MKRKGLKPSHFNFIVLTVIMLSAANQVSAQSPYRGGQGDGYAMGFVSNIVLGIDNSQDLNNQVSLYPNPATQRTNLEVICASGAGFRVEIMNLLGQMVYNQNFINERVVISLAAFKPGSYIVQIWSGNQYQFQKLVIAQP